MKALLESTQSPRQWGPPHKGKREISDPSSFLSVFKMSLVTPRNINCLYLE